MHYWFIFFWISLCNGVYCSKCEELCLLKFQSPLVWGNLMICKSIALEKEIFIFETKLIVKAPAVS